MSYYIKVSKQEDIKDAVNLFTEILDCCHNPHPWGGIYLTKVKGKCLKYGGWAVGIHGKWTPIQIVWLKADTSTTNWEEQIVEVRPRKVNEIVPEDAFMVKVYKNYLAQLEMKKLAENV